MPYCLGKLPARPDAVKLKFARYLTGAPLPNVGHESLLPADLGMFANDHLGDCAWAMSAHLGMLFSAMGGAPASFSDDSVLSDYSACCGYKPSVPGSDRGTDMQEQASYWLKTGILDAKGQRHKIGAYLALTLGNMTEINAAIKLVGGVGIGIMFPDYAMTQFENHLPWSYVYNSRIPTDGHAIPLIGQQGNFITISWARMFAIRPLFLESYMDEGYVYLSEEIMHGGMTLEGIDLPTLRDDFAKL